MDPRQTVPLDESRLAEVSRAFAAELFARFPQLRQYAEMERFCNAEEWSLAVIAPSPAVGTNLALVIWLEGTVPSVQFGGWHTHGEWHPREDVGDWDAVDAAPDQRLDFLDLIAGLLDDRLVVHELRGTDMSRDWILLDRFDREGLLDVLTGPQAPSRVVSHSWSGAHDREIGLADMEGS